ncbi:MAG: 6,7-dimethyl-8-ribityllumazine synthase [Deltaproteobacteria bacterium]|nr:6,7-dimethyl-8-ribityllumazine synthase [Deltaproteobacteria bacterium]
MRTPASIATSTSHPPADLQVAVVVSRFHTAITERLLDGAVQQFAHAGVAQERVRVFRVPGAFEIPVVAAALARSGTCHGVLTLGCVARGETPHFDHICRTVADGLQRVAVDTGVPVVFGVLTVETLAQAEARAGGPLGNSGAEGAATLLEMCGIMNDVRRCVR